MLDLKEVKWSLTSFYEILELCKSQHSNTHAYTYIQFQLNDYELYSNLSKHVPA